MVAAQPVATFAQIARFVGNEMVVLETVNNTDMLREFSVTNTSTADFNEDDGAVFECLAVNANGNATTNATITVQGELYIEYHTSVQLYTCTCTFMLDYKSMHSNREREGEYPTLVFFLCNSGMTFIASIAVITTLLHVL